MILGFVAEGAQHGYELKQRMAQLHGYARPISDGTIYPAIKRLVAAGSLTEHREPGQGAAQRKILRITTSGEEHLQRMLRDADGHDVTDGSRFFIVLAFLSQLSDEEERRAVLRRRLDYLDRPTSFFYDGDRPLYSAEITDPYRLGILISARATRDAERTWLRQQLDPINHDPVEL